MPIIQFIIVMVIIGVIMFLVNKYGSPWMQPVILQILNIAVVVVVIVWILSMFVDMGSFGNFRIGRPIGN